MNGWSKALEMDVIIKTMTKILAIYYYVQGEAMENKREDLVNVLKNDVTLSFENIKNVTETTEHNLDEEVNGNKKVDRKLLKDWTWKINAILKETKSDNIIGSNRFIKASVIFVGRKAGLNQTKKEEML